MSGKPSIAAPMSAIHIYRARTQRATRYYVEIDVRGKPMRITIRNPPRRRVYASCCRERRIAQNLFVQSYYDGDRFSCRPGTGCEKG